MDAGELVSDDIVLGMIRERLAKPDADNGFILDGFPRNLAQAQSLDGLLEELGAPLDAAVLMDVDFDVLLKRLTGRRTCAGCGRVYWQGSHHQHLTALVEQVRGAEFDESAHWREHSLLLKGYLALTLERAIEIALDGPELDASLGPALVAAGGAPRGPAAGTSARLARSPSRS